MIDSPGIQVGVGGDGGKRAQPESLRGERIVREFAGEGAVDAPPRGGRALSNRQLGTRHPGITKTNAIWIGIQQLVDGQTDRSPLPHPHLGAGDSQPSFPGAGILRRLLEKAFKGGDSRDVGLGKQVDLPTQEQIDRHVPVHQLDEGLVSGIAGRLFVQRLSPVSDGGFFVAGGSVGGSGAVHITDAVNGPLSEAENIIEVRVWIVRTALLLFRIGRGEDFIVDRGSLVPAAIALENARQPIEKTRFLRAVCGDIGGSAQCIRGLRPLAGREPDIGDPLLHGAGDLRALLQESAVGGGGIGVAAQAGQRFGMQEEAVDATGVVC